MRVLSEVLVAIAVIELLDLQVAQLGNLFGSGNLYLGPSLAYPFTVIAIFGIINAFNMLDGMDGLLASLVYHNIGAVPLVHGHPTRLCEPRYWRRAFCLFSFQPQSTRPWSQSFLGDAGSKLLGFIVVCLLLAAASGQVGNIKLIQPVTALFVVALPLYDMVLPACAALSAKGLPLRRTDLIFITFMQDLGFSDRRALVIIVCIHSSVARLA